MRAGRTAGRRAGRGEAALCACAPSRAPLSALGACALRDCQYLPRGRAAAGKWQLRLLLPPPLGLRERPDL